MRQAGRSLPEYRELRHGITMLDSCSRPDLVAEITLQPVRRYGVDAAIFYSDIMVPLQAAGVDLEIVSGQGPIIDEPVRRLADLDQIRPLEPDALWFVTEAVERLVAELGPTPLIGFAGAPFTLASYLVEGGPSKDYARTKALMISEPELWDGLCSRLAELSATFLRTQVAAGASAVQLFDSWAGSLSAADYARVRPAVLGPGARAPWPTPACPGSTSAWAPSELLRPDGRGRRRGGRRGLAAAAGRGQPADRAGVRGAGQPRPGAAVRPVAGAGRAGPRRWCGPAPRPRATSSTSATAYRPRPTPTCWPGSSTWCTPRVPSCGPRRGSGSRPACDDDRRRRRRRDHRPGGGPGAARGGPRGRRAGAGPPLGRQARAARAGRRHGWTAGRSRCSPAGRRRVGLGRGRSGSASAGPPDRGPAALLVGGALHPMPPSLLGVPTDVDGAARAAEPGRATGAPSASPTGPAPALEPDAAIGAVVDDRFGPEVTDRLLEPLLGGVYAGHARRCPSPPSARTCSRGRRPAARCSSTPGRRLAGRDRRPGLRRPGRRAVDRWSRR